MLRSGHRGWRWRQLLASIPRRSTGGFRAARSGRRSGMAGATVAHARQYVLGSPFAVCGSRDLTERDLPPAIFGKVWRGELGAPDGYELCALCAERVVGREAMLGGASRLRGEGR